MKLQLDDYSISRDQLIEIGGGARYPAIMATTYEPSVISQKIGFAITPEVIELGLITSRSIELLNLQPKICIYASKEIGMLEIAADVRWVILTKPRLFAVDKVDKKVYPIEPGVRLRDIGRVTTTKLFLAAIVGKELLISQDGSPQIFTFKLKSTAVGLVSLRDRPDVATIETLNRALQKHYAAPTGWCTHFASVMLEAYPEKKTSSIDTSQSKVATSYRFVGEAISVPQVYNESIYSLIASEDFKKMAADPFRLNRTAEVLPTADSLDNAPRSDYYAYPHEQ